MTPIQKALQADHKLSNTGGWQDRHNQALIAPRGFERAIILACETLTVLALAYKARFEDEIGTDYEIGGRGFEPMLRGTRYLLNGETGRLDCGTIDGFLVALAESTGVDL